MGTGNGATRGGVRQRPGVDEDCGGGRNPVRGGGRGPIVGAVGGPQVLAQGTNPKEKLTMHSCKKVVCLIQLDFAEKELLEELAW